MVGNFAGEETGWKNSIQGYRDSHSHIAPVGSYPCNRFGLYDMGGNAWEWSLDENPEKEGYHYLHGGSWISFREDNSKRGYRFSNDGGSFNYSHGFRCVLVLGGSS